MSPERQVELIRLRIKELRKDPPGFSIADSSTLEALSCYLSADTKDCILQEFSDYLGVEPIIQLEWVLREIFEVTP